MAIKDTNHRVAVTLSGDEYDNLRALAGDMGGKSVSKAAARAVRGYFEQTDEVVNLRFSLVYMADLMVSTCWYARDWHGVWSCLKDASDNQSDPAFGVLRDAVLRQLSEGYMSSRYRDAYAAWCDKEGKRSYL